MGVRVESGGHYNDYACLNEDEAPAPTAARDQGACERAMVEEGIAHAACVGSALWTAGSIPSVLGAIDGAIATGAACGYAALKSADTNVACGIQPHADPNLAWSSDSS